MAPGATLSVLVLVLVLPGALDDGRSTSRWAASRALGWRWGCTRLLATNSTGSHFHFDQIAGAGVTASNRGYPDQKWGTKRGTKRSLNKAKPSIHAGFKRSFN